MSVYIGDVQTFAGAIADKPQVLKIGEEIMEVFSAWEDYKESNYTKERHKEALIAEIADVIQAACNLLAAIGVDDMRQPMQECYVRNKERGREYANDTFSAENDVTAQDVDANDENVTQDSREKLEADVRKCFDPPEQQMIIRWLDRQAAITEEQTRYKWVTKSAYEIAEMKMNLNIANGDFEAARLELEEKNAELQEQADNQKKAAENFRDMWQKADARCSELKAENDGLKARIESLRSKLSKMLDAASVIQHIGDLP